MSEIAIDLSSFFNSNAKLSELDNYVQKAKLLAGFIRKK